MPVILADSFRKLLGIERTDGVSAQSRAAMQKEGVLPEQLDQQPPPPPEASYKDSPRVVDPERKRQQDQQLKDLLEKQDRERNFLTK